MKYLFEMVGLYPATAAVTALAGDSLGSRFEALLQRREGTGAQAEVLNLTPEDKAVDTVK